MLLLFGILVLLVSLLVLIRAFGFLSEEEGMAGFVAFLLGALAGFSISFVTIMVYFDVLNEPKRMSHIRISDITSLIHDSLGSDSIMPSSWILRLDTTDLADYPYVRGYPFSKPRGLSYQDIDKYGIYIVHGYIYKEKPINSWRHLYDYKIECRFVSFPHEYHLTYISIDSFGGESMGTIYYSNPYDIIWTLSTASMAEPSSEAQQKIWPFVLE